MAQFSEIYREHVQKVYRFLLVLTENEAQAEELTQQTFYKAFLNIGRFEERSSVYTWLCQIGKNEWLQECRKNQPVSFERIEEVAVKDSLEEDLVRKSQIAMIREAILGLSPPYRDVLILRTYGELPFAEIAALFGHSESWAKVTFFRGKEKLKKRMEESI